MDLKKYKADLKHKIADNIDSCFNELGRTLNYASDKFDVYILYKSKYNKIKKDTHLNIAQRQDLEIELSKLILGVLEFVNDLNEGDFNNDIPKNDDTRNLKVEQFCNKYDWNKLEKIGNWKLDEINQEITGKGVYQFILSNFNYGTTTTLINTILIFGNYEKFAHEIIDNANAGIILGWTKNDKVSKYYNLLLTGNKIVLELVGANGGDDYRDFNHLNSGESFSLIEGVEYNFVIKISSSSIDVFVDDVFTYSVRTPKDIEGKVGLRPWRSKIDCKYFEVREYK